jgi:hypothetical protein
MERPYVSNDARHDPTADTRRSMSLNPPILTLSRSIIFWRMSLVALLLICLPGKAQGIPEPSLLVYGVITDSGSGSRVTFGSLQWVYRPVSGGASITVTTTLTNINDQFSYVLRVPCESELVGISVSPGALKLAATPTSYDRSQVKVHGTNATFVQASLLTLTLNRTDRGLIQRVDLTVALSLGNGLPEAWQLQYFGRTGVDPGDDPDHDGMTNLQEFKAGTHPQDDQSLFEFIRVQVEPTGGVRVAWPSAVGKSYTVLRSSSLTSGFSNLQVNIPATTPENNFIDATATGAGPYFYRLQVE